MWPKIKPNYSERANNNLFYNINSFSKEVIINTNFHKINTGANI